MADWMFGFVVVLVFGLCLTDLAESGPIPIAKVLQRPGKPTVSKVDGLAVTFTWSIPANATGTQIYEVQYTADKENAVIHRRVSTNRVTLNLGPNKWYTVRVRAFDPKGVGLLSDALRIRSNESRPGKAPPNVVVKPQLPTLNVTWKPIPPDHHNGILVGYVVLITIYGTVDWKKHHTTKTSIQIMGLDTTKTYTIRVAGLTKEGLGVKSVAIHFNSIGPLGKTTPRPFKTIPPASVASTQGTTSFDMTTKVSLLTDKNIKRTVDVNSESTRKITSVRSHVPTTERIPTAETMVIKEIHKTTQLIGTERMVGYSQAKPKETAILRKIILFGVPALGFIVLFSCFVGYMLWRRKKSHQKKLNSDSARAEKKRKPVVTRGENTVTYCLPPPYTEKQALESKSDATPHILEVQHSKSGKSLRDVYDQDKQRIYESMDGLRSALNGDVDEHRYVEPDQLCVVLPARQPDPDNVPGQQPETEEPRKEPQYANVGQICHLYEALDFQDQGPFYANAKAGPNSETPSDKGE